MRIKKFFLILSNRMHGLNFRNLIFVDDICFHRPVFKLILYHNIELFYLRKSNLLTLGDLLKEETL
jgi:hypothetical protein